MNSRMVYFSEIESLSASCLAFSDAYLDSAARLCDILAKSPPGELTYPRGAVVLSLAHHGTELFLKAAILKNSPNEKVGSHDLDRLSTKYTKLYPGKEYAFDIVFRAEEPENMYRDRRTIEEVKDQLCKHKRGNPIDQLYRYPINTKGKPWDGIYAFEPNSFAVILSKTQQEIARLKDLIFTC